MADGYLGKCKACSRRDVIENRTKNLDYYRKYDRTRANDPVRVAGRQKYAETEKCKVNQRRIKSEWNKRNEIKREAHDKVRQAILKGNLQRQPCEKCNTTDKVEAHHEDYSKPLEVMWLCDAHHKERHKFLRWGDDF